MNHSAADRTSRLFGRRTEARIAAARSLSRFVDESPPLSPLHRNDLPARRVGAPVAPRSDSLGVLLRGVVRLRDLGNGREARPVAMFASSFRGRVTSVVRQGDDEIATFVVLETYRGVAAGTQTIAIHYYVGISPCPIPRFSVGQVARVYANPSPEGLRVHFCNPSGRDPA